MSVGASALGRSTAPASRRAAASVAREVGEVTAAEQRAGRQLGGLDLGRPVHERGDLGGEPALGHPAAGRFEVLGHQGVDLVDGRGR